MAAQQLYSVIDDYQINIRDDGPDAEQVREGTLDRIRDWMYKQDAALKRETGGRMPYFANVPADRVAFHLGVTLAVGRMRDVLAAHPDFHADFDTAMARAIRSGEVAAETARREMRWPGDTLPLLGPTIRAIGVEFGIPMPKQVA